MSFLMSESPVEVPVEVPVEEPVEITQLEHDRLLFERRNKARSEYLAEHNDPDEAPVMNPVMNPVEVERRKQYEAERNILLNDPLLDPVLARNIREGVRVGFRSLRLMSNTMIKESFRQPLLDLHCCTPWPQLAVPPPFKDIPTIDREFYEEMLDQARDTFEVCVEQLKYVMNIANEQQQRYVKQAEALKDDPTKQTEYQAQWTKADEIHRSLVKINQVIRYGNILESFTQPGFLETPSSE